MATQLVELTIRVDPEAARRYREANDRERLKLDLLMTLGLHDALEYEGTLEDLMHEMSREAQAKGLTPEILESILNEQ